MRKVITSSDGEVADNMAAPAVMVAAKEDVLPVDPKQADKRQKAAMRRANKRARAMPVVKTFDDLPNSAYVGLAVVEALLNCSTATVWRRIKSRALPDLHRIGSSNAMNVGDLREALPRR